MCGLAGFLAPGGFDPDAATVTVDRMTDAISHRGPDDAGRWLDGSAGVALGHRRLSILDLSAAGHQPMLSESGRFVLAFNGEIYNHLELRQKLEPRLWRGHSDTETLLAGIEEWGFERTLQQCIGMFAIALFDREARVLSLARDRMGEKPLYFGWQGGSFLFASELKALRQHPAFAGIIDRGALAAYAQRGYVPTPRSIFAGIHKLSAGAILTVGTAAAVGSYPAPRPYWSLHQVIAEQAGHRYEGSPEEAVEQLTELLRDATVQQQLADVPLGAFLSGGIDSSTVVALMQANSSVPIRTYTIGFVEQAYNEAHYGRAVADHLRTDHTELMVSSQDALDLIPELPRIFDEPFADLSQIPTVLVSRLARRNVTVALSGDGGDELFCGYGHYPRTAQMWQRLARIPLSLRVAAHYVLPSRALRDGVAARDVDDLYRFLGQRWKGHPDIALNARDDVPAVEIPNSLREAQERVMYRDALEYLPDDILVKVDRAAMSTSLETRVPILDHRVVEFAWRLPLSIKRRDGIGKWPLRQVLYKYVPEAIVNRPKMGFGVPMEHWLRGSLRGWAEELLSEQRLRSEGFFDAPAVRKEWQLHLSGKKDRHYALWPILMFQAWSESTRRADRHAATPRREPHETLGAVAGGASGMAR